MADVAHPGGQGPGFIVRTIYALLRWLIVIVFQISVVCLIVKAGILYFSDDFEALHPYDSLARVYLAFRDSFHALPESLGFIVGIIAFCVQYVLDVLESELGYSPLDIDWSGFNSGEGWTSTSSAIEPLGFDLTSLALNAAIMMTAAQIAIMFLFLIFGARHHWSYVGVLSFKGTRPVYFSVLLKLCAVGFLIKQALNDHGMVAAVIVSVVTLILFRFPIVAGLIVHFVTKVLGIDPARLIRGANQISAVVPAPWSQPIDHTPHPQAIEAVPLPPRPEEQLESLVSTPPGHLTDTELLGLPEDFTREELEACRAETIRNPRQRRWVGAHHEAYERLSARLDDQTP